MLCVKYITTTFLTFHIGSPVDYMDVTFMHNMLTVCIHVHTYIYVYTYIGTFISFGMLTTNTRD